MIKKNKELKLAFIACFSILNLRAIPRIRFINLWAEDASVFATDAFQQGWKSLFVPIAGYQAFIPRVIAWLGLAVPLDRYALFFFEAYTLCASAILVYFIHDDFESIVPGKKNRAFVSFTICFSAGLSESLGNLCNLHWFFSLALGFMIMRKLSAATTWKHVAAAALFGLSAGESLVFVPFFVVRWFLKKKYFKTSDHPELMIALLLFCIAILNYATRDASHFRLIPIEPTGLLLATIYTWINHFMLAPLLGANPTRWVGGWDISFWAFGGLVTWIYARVFIKNKTPDGRLVYLALLPVLGTVFLSWMVRKTAFDHFSQQARIANFWQHNRYSLNISPIAAILMMSQFPRIRGKFDPKIFKTLGILFIIQSSFSFVIYLEGHHAWADTIHKLTQGPIDCEKTYRVDSDPEGWSVSIPGQLLCDFKSKKSAAR